MVYEYPNGDLLVPRRADQDGVLADGMERITSEHEDYGAYREAIARGAESVNATGDRATGQERFDAMTPAEQDEQFGPEKAEALRDGTISLADLVDHSPLDTAEDFITEKPLNAAL